MSRPIIETEETLIIETPERVQLEFALASIGNRFLAVAIDHFLQYLSMFIIAWIMNQPEMWQVSPSVRPIVQKTASLAFRGSVPSLPSHSPTRRRWSHSSASIFSMWVLSGDGLSDLQWPR